MYRIIINLDQLLISVPRGRSRIFGEFDKKKNAEGSHECTRHCTPAGSDDPYGRMLQDIQKEIL